jgi:hypothetical protein
MVSMQGHGTKKETQNTVADLVFFGSFPQNQAINFEHCEEFLVHLSGSAFDITFIAWVI